MASQPHTVLVTGGAGFIGSHLVAELRSRGHRAVILDAVPPTDGDPDWVQADILDPSAMKRTMDSVVPTVVAHLAARTDTSSDDLDEYAVNMDGTRIVAEAAAMTQSVRRFLYTSTQYVAANGTDVSDPLSFAPFTAYGESKARSEVIVRETLDGRLPWVIVRPTNIWGPRHPRYPTEFWRIVDRGLYLHPGNDRVLRTYGYVENTAWQMAQLIEAPTAVFDGAVYYLGEPAIDLRDWVDQFSLGILGRRAIRVPTWVIKGLAKFGDGAKRVRMRFPITSSRYRSMTTDYVVPTESTIAALGEPPYSMEAGVSRTVDWLRESGMLRHTASR